MAVSATTSAGCARIQSIAASSASDTCGGFPGTTNTAQARVRRHDVAHPIRSRRSKLPGKGMDACVDVRVDRRAESHKQPVFAQPFDVR
jgi:hypothetical protein